MRLIKSNNIKSEYPKRVFCDECGAELEIEENDVFVEDYNKKIPITQCLEVRATNTNKSNCLTTIDKDNVLTPLPIGRYPDAFNKNLPFRYYTTKEMCRLQTLPDNYLDMIPNTAARKALGNGWTVDVIAHIFSFLPDEYKIKE